jgi:hypothetical protein
LPKLCLWLPSQEGMTALAIACKEGCIDIAFQLLAAGAYVNIQVGVVPACFDLLLKQIIYGHVSS